eukprot:Sspe_Gene.28341::Locus_12783_Transcript_2_2_Confidence_0.667_Length_1908::g.28341::m.28341
MRIEVALLTVGFPTASIDLPDDATLLDLKMRVLDSFEAQPLVNNQRVTFAGRELDQDDAPLTSFGITESSRVTVALSLSRIKVTVMLLTTGLPSKEITLTGPVTVGDLRKAIHENFESRPSEQSQRISYGGHELTDDSETLASLGVSDGARFAVAINMDGSEIEMAPVAQPPALPEEPQTPPRSAMVTIQLPSMHREEIELTSSLTPAAALARLQERDPDHDYHGALFFNGQPIPADAPLVSVVGTEGNVVINLFPRRDNDPSANYRAEPRTGSEPFHTESEEGEQHNWRMEWSQLVAVIGLVLVVAGGVLMSSRRDRDLLQCANLSSCYYSVVNEAHSTTPGPMCRDCGYTTEAGFCRNSESAVISGYVPMAACEVARRSDQPPLMGRWMSGKDAYESMGQYGKVLDLPPTVWAGRYVPKKQYVGINQDCLLVEVYAHDISSTYPSLCAVPGTASQMDALRPAFNQTRKERFYFRSKLDYPPILYLERYHQISYDDCLAKCTFPCRAFQYSSSECILLPAMAENLLLEEKTSVVVAVGEVGDVVRLAECPDADTFDCSYDTDGDLKVGSSEERVVSLAGCVTMLVLGGLLLLGGLGLSVMLR